LRKFKHSLEHLSRLPEEFAQGCDILQVRIVCQDVRQHAGKPYVVTTFALETWQEKQPETRIETLGSALTVLRERKPGKKPPFVLVETSSLTDGCIASKRCRHEVSAMSALKGKFNDLIAGFTTLPAGGDHDPAA